MSAEAPSPLDGNTGATAEEAALAEVLESYLAELKAGAPTDPERLIAAYPELARPLRTCLKVMHRPRHAGDLARRMSAYQAGVQERLQAAERARVEAQARAAEERKRRRLTVALTASVLVIAGLVEGGWTSRVRQRQERAARFNCALGETEALPTEARQAGDDLGRWLTARDAASAIEGLLPDAPDERTRSQVTALVRNRKQN
jgi:serine/threonine-protein kinase